MVATRASARSCRRLCPGSRTPDGGARCCLPVADRGGLPVAPSSGGGLAAVALLRGIRRFFTWRFDCGTCRDDTSVHTTRAPGLQTRAFIRRLCAFMDFEWPLRLSSQHKATPPLV